MTFSLTVYCGSRGGTKPAYAAAAAALGHALAERGGRLVYGGGSVGLMGVVANACLDAGGEVIGVIPRLLYEQEVGHDGCTELHVVDNMHQRKHQMAALGDAFAALPGGIGTMEELFEMYTWLQLGFHEKRVGILDVDGYYAPFIAQLDHMVAEGFVDQRTRSLLQHFHDPISLLDGLAAAPTRF